MQTDPFGYSVGINLYAYVNNNPVNWIDPYGLSEDKPGKKPSEFEDKINQALSRVEKTKRGKELIDETIRKGTAIKEIEENAYYDPRTNEIRVDPDFHPNIETTAGRIPASTERILAHEMQHATGTQDEMETIRKGENPVAIELGEPSRTRY